MKVFGERAAGMKKSAIWIGALLALTAAVYGALEIPNGSAPAGSEPLHSARPEASPGKVSYEAAQQIFNARCVACHSCNNAPCQLKLTSYDGLQRGASKIQAIDPTRLQSIAPTRLGIDARSAGEWRRQGFFAVAGDRADLLLPMINQGPARSPADTPANSRLCPANIHEAEALKSAHPDKLMPYGLPPLTEAERNVLVGWVEGGSKPPVAQAAEELSPQEALAKSKWEEFFNARDIEHRLVARYLYEHLFLAGLHFGADSAQFHRIVRSRTACNTPLDEIATRRPSDDPKGAFHYCFQRNRETIVEKTHLPYLLDQAKLNQVAGLFFDPREPWKAGRWPDYTSSDSTNPFAVYQDIPVKIRYRFLLEDSRYHVATFIKGPVCYGSGAVSSIDEHFFVFFMKPESELMVRDPAFAKQSEDLLILPFMDGSDAPLIEAPSFDEMWAALLHKKVVPDKYVAARNEYVALKQKHRRAAFKTGYRLDDLWNGDGVNPNAVLTVFRHFDHSYVLNGLRGGAPTSYFVLDYGLLERLVYNLAVGYDVFGNVSHQLHTRLYMEMLRREAEDNFLLFLPPPERARLRGRWYQTELAKIWQKVFYDPNDEKFPTQIAYSGATGTDKELIRKIGADYLAAAVRGPYDGTPHSEYLALEAMAEKPAGSAPFVKLFPDSSLLLIEAGGRIEKAVTIIRDRAHSALGRLILESTARLPEEDRLAVVDGFATSYPNLFFDVPEERLPDFLRELKAVDSPATAQAFLRSWAILKTDPRFWDVSDRLHAHLRRLDPVSAGVLDYTRYGIWTEEGDWR